MMWTLWATALQMGRNPLAYLREYLTACRGGKSP